VPAMGDWVITAPMSDEPRHLYSQCTRKPACSPVETALAWSMPMTFGTGVGQLSAWRPMCTRVLNAARAPAAGSCCTTSLRFGEP
jgi:hypothetical protein